MRTVHSKLAQCIAVAALAAAIAAIPAISEAVEVKTVPWVAANPLVPHDIVSGAAHTLKGTSDVQGATIQSEWDPGDGSAPIGGTVVNQYVVEATHIYACAPEALFIATLTVTDTATGESDSADYLVQCTDTPTLEIEVNMAIDQGLWYLHRSMQRPADLGDWIAGSFASSGNLSTSAANVNAFEIQGHLESGDASNPYTETVARGLRHLFNGVNAVAISSQTNGLGTFDPDANGNGLGVRVSQGTELYQGGMIIDAIVASGTPGAVTTTGPADVLGRTYADIVQDMIDYYSFCQYDGAEGGGWRYSCNSFPDNSANQWAAIGMIPGERVFGATVPQEVKDWNEVWVNFSQAADGSLGYTSTSSIWGPYATTPSGMVQMALGGIGRGDARWDDAEAFIRANFGNTGGSPSAIKNYYYGLFSFTKSMLLHDSNADGVAEPIDLLGGDLDWYAAEASAGDPTDGVARTLVGDQNPAGYWSGNNTQTGAQFPFETAWAIIMLNKTVVEPQPVAVCDAVPNPGVVGATITLDGSASFHLDATKSIVAYEWDLDDDGAFDDATGATTTTSYGALGLFNVGLLVTDDFGATDAGSCLVDISIPPLAPTAEAGGPYTLCEGQEPWLLDGTGSVNPDDGESEPDSPPDSITAFDWDLDGNADFADASGAEPDVTAFFQGLGVGDYLVQLRVTDNTAASFPSAGQPDLTDTDSAEVRVRPSDDPVCVIVIEDPCKEARALLRSAMDAIAALDVASALADLRAASSLAGFLAAENPDQAEFFLRAQELIDQAIALLEEAETASERRRRALIRQALDLVPKAVAKLSAGCVRLDGGQKPR